MTVESQSAALQLLQRLSVPEMVSRLAAHPANMARLAKLLLDGGEKGRAVDLATEARRLAPHDPEVERVMVLVLARSVPQWHHSILADEARNAAYDAALRRNVRAGSRVLDIGAGSGLLAMMAARAGAARGGELRTQYRHGWHGHRNRRAQRLCRSHQHRPQAFA